MQKCQFYSRSHLPSAYSHKYCSAEIRVTHFCIIFIHCLKIQYNICHEVTIGVNTNTIVDDAMSENQKKRKNEKDGMMSERTTFIITIIHCLKIKHLSQNYCSGNSDQKVLILAIHDSQRGCI